MPAAGFPQDGGFLCRSGLRAHAAARARAGAAFPPPSRLRNLPAATARAAFVARAPHRGPAAATFPGYLFVWVELQWHPARWAPGVAALIMDGVGPAEVPDSVIVAIRSRESVAWSSCHPGCGVAIG